ncbi:MAG TPA: serine/threonine-protein kinase [Myxococcaceae bacterium]|nr:serine/threonine-protein kinase [Myxococcaceae bacterium]
MAVAAGQEQKRWCRVVARRRLLRRALVSGSSSPRVGDKVGSYRLEAKLGQGGFGTVFRARHGGRRYAVKFLSLAGTDEWGWRELEVLLRLRQVGGVTLEGHGKWPDRSPRFLYIAMEYVRGRTLHDWARQENPTARQVAAMLLPLARYLAEVHAKGIAHRDVKGENILVRGDGRPVLVDFGVGTFEGALEVTGWRVPGTRPYQSPEAIGFMRQRRGEERYPLNTGDDVWALGVVLHKLLTDAMPFEGRSEGELAESILTHTPVPPHERNPRVPGALGELCLRLLEKEPEARLGQAQALAEALEAALAGADATWDVPLCEAYAPDNVTTLRSRTFPLELEAEVARMERLREYARQHPLRGPRPPARQSSAEPSPEQPVEREQPTPVPPRARAPAWRWGLWGGLGLALGLVVLLAAARLLPPPEQDALALAPEVIPTSPLKAPVPLEPESAPAAPGQEVAPVQGPPDGGEGAAPPRAATPAPVANATRSEHSMRVKTPRPRATVTPKKKQQKSNTMRDTLRKAGLVCATVAQTACSGPQVRPTPPSEECPAGAVEAMRELGLSSREPVHAFLNRESPGLVTVREGPTTAETTREHGQLPAGTELTGWLFIWESRVHGRFTQARLPDGRILPVCMIAWDDRDRQAGLGPGRRGTVGSETATISPTMSAKVVQRFESPSPPPKR